MFHMLTCFDLKPDTSIEGFQKSLEAFTEHLRSLDIIEGCGPIGLRQNDTILDTDEERGHQYFMLMHFRDRAQSDKAIEYIESFKEPGDSIHTTMYAKVQDPVFICWQDI
jgi:arginase family enzyme